MQLIPKCFPYLPVAAAFLLFFIFFVYTLVNIESLSTTWNERDAWKLGDSWKSNWMRLNLWKLDWQAVGLTSALPPVIRLPYAYTSGPSNSAQFSKRPRAVCIAGYRDALRVKGMAQSLINKVLRPNDADLFVFITVENISEFPIKDFQRLYKPWLRDFVILQESAFVEEVERYRVAQSDNSILNPVHARILLKIHKCYDNLIAPYERARGMLDYQQIFYARPDLYYLTPLNMHKYSDPLSLYSPRPFNHAKHYDQDPKNDGLLIWPDNAVGVNDQSFLASSQVFRMISHALWVVFPSVPELRHIHETFIEHQLLWVVRERFNITVRAITDMENTICHDGYSCYNVNRDHVQVSVKVEDENVVVNIPTAGKN